MPFSVEVRHARQLRPSGARADVAPGPARPSAVPAQLVRHVLRGSGQPLAMSLKEEMEGRLGADFSHVRVHTDGAARASAAGIGARAYTAGDHVVIGEGGADKHTLAHELTHVIQQRQGPVGGTDHGSGLKVSDQLDVFEKAAEADAARVMRTPLSQHRQAPAGTGEQRAAPVAAVQRRVGFEAELSVPTMPAPPEDVTLENNLRGGRATPGNRAVTSILGTSIKPPTIQRKREITDEHYPHQSPPKGDNGPLTKQASERHYDESKEKGQELLKALDNWEAHNKIREKIRIEDTSEKLREQGYMHSVSQLGGGQVEMKSSRQHTEDELANNGEAPYRNQYGGGEFTAISNFRDRDAPGAGVPAPPNSEIIFEQYRRAAQALDLDVSGNLSLIARESIVNANTQHTIFWCDKGEEVNENKLRQARGDDRAALLGSQNGRSAAYLVLQHGEEIGANGLSEIEYARGSSDSRLHIHVRRDQEEYL